MSWLRDHFHRFVFPAFLAAEKKSSEIGSPVDVPISPSAPKHLPSELRKLWSLCAEHKTLWSYDTREVANGWSSYRKSARIHDKILRNTLRSSLVAMRAEKCSRLFFGGRDVWALAVIAERWKVPYLFVPELSRNVVNTVHVKAFLESRGFTGDELFIDTGFVGSIPRSLKSSFDRDFKFRLMSQHRQNPYAFDYSPDADYLTDENIQKAGVTKNTPGWKKVVWNHYLAKRGVTTATPNQPFPTRKNARTEALETEYLAKYWKTGMVDSEGNVIQYLATREHIQRAALITSMLWRGVTTFDPNPPAAGEGYTFSYNDPFAFKPLQSTSTSHFSALSSADTSTNNTLTYMATSKTNLIVTADPSPEENLPPP